MVLLPGCSCCGKGGGCECCPNRETVSLKFSVPSGSGSGFHYECSGGKLFFGSISYTSKAFDWSPTPSDVGTLDPCIFADTVNHNPEAGGYTNGDSKNGFGIGGEQSVYGYGVQLCPLSLGSGMASIGGSVYTTGANCPDDESWLIPHVPTVFDQEAIFVRATQEVYSPYWFIYDFNSYGLAEGEELTLTQSRDIIKMQRLWEREEPQITIVCPSTTGKDAEFVPVFKKYTDGAGQDMWQLESVTVKSGGSGYNPAQKNNDTNTTRLLLSSTNIVGSLPVMVPTFSAASAPASITGVTLTTTPGGWPNGNLFVGKKGYLQSYSRSQPTITATSAGGMKFSVTLAKHGSGAALPSQGGSLSSVGEYWEVSSLSISDNGTGPWKNGQSVEFKSYGAAGGGAQAQVQAATTYAPPPSVKVMPPAWPGSGATLDYTLTKIEPGTPPFYNSIPVWQVTAISVTNPGVGYLNGGAVRISVPEGYEYFPASASLVVARSAPSFTPYVWGTSGTTAGTGAVLTVTMTATTDYDGKPAWEASAVNVVSGGSGYAVGEYLWYQEFGGSFQSNPPYYVVEIDGWVITSVDGSGAITGVGIEPGSGYGLYYRLSRGPIASVTVTNPGTYFKATTTPSGVTLTQGGKYYVETIVNKSEPLAELKCDGSGWEEHEVQLRLAVQGNPNGTPECPDAGVNIYKTYADNIAVGGSYGTVSFAEPCAGQAEQDQYSRSVEDMDVEITFE